MTAYWVVAKWWYLIQWVWSVTARPNVNWKHELGHSLLHIWKCITSRQFETSYGWQGKSTELWDINALVWLYSPLKNIYYKRLFPILVRIWYKANIRKRSVIHFFHLVDSALHCFPNLLKKSCNCWLMVRH